MPDTNIVVRFCVTNKMALSKLFPKRNIEKRRDFSVKTAVSSHNKIVGCVRFCRTRECMSRIVSDRFARQN